MDYLPQYMGVSVSPKEADMLISREKAIRWQMTVPADLMDRWNACYRDVERVATWKARHG